MGGAGLGMLLAGIWVRGSVRIRTLPSKPLLKPKKVRMERVYLLLRNNLQTGPFTFDELLQQQLRPSDLIWMEGRSTAWAHLSEFEFLPRHFEEDLPRASNESKRFHPDSIEQRAEAIRMNTLSYTYHHKPHIEMEARESLPPAAADVPIEIIRHAPARRGPSLQLLGAGVVTVLVGISLYGGWSFIRDNDRPEEGVAIQLSAESFAAAKAPEQRPSALVLAKDTLLSAPVADSAATVLKPVRKTVKPVADSQEARASDTVAVTEKEPPAREEAAVEKPPVVPTPVEQAPVKKEDKDTVAASQKEPVVEEKEKKSLGQLFKGIFKKKKKKTEEKASSGEEN